MTAIFEDVIWEIQGLTDINYITESYIVGTEYLMSRIEEESDEQRLELILREFNVIKSCQEQRGYMPPQISGCRYASYKAMLEIAKKVLSPEEYHSFYMSF